jgi:hypothetical protein
VPLCATALASASNEPSKNDSKERTGKKRKGEPYKCGKCRSLKKGHICQLKRGDTIRAADKKTQTDVKNLPKHPRNIHYVHPNTVDGLATTVGICGEANEAIMKEANVEDVETVEDDDDTSNNNNNMQA